MATLAGGVLSTLAAALTLRLHATWVPRLVSFAVGALLGAVFLDLVPEALRASDASYVMRIVLAGLLGFFLLEKLVLWRHAHGHEEHVEEAEETEHDHALHRRSTSDGGRSGGMILIGNGVHSFCDGIAIAAAFLASPALGLATTLAIVAHAVPQQVGDFAVLLLATLAGGLAAYFALAGMERILPTVLALAAASLLYVAVADLIPSLHRRAEPAETLKQMIAILCGVATIAIAVVFLEA